MLVDAREPEARSAVHLVFVREKVRPDYLEPVPGFSPPVRTAEGILLAPVADLVRMKLTSYRLKDRVHLQDLDAVGLITPEVEASSPTRCASGCGTCAPRNSRTGSRASPNFRERYAEPAGGGGGALRRLRAATAKARK
jgi:hypothetical protein